MPFPESSSSGHAATRDYLPNQGAVNRQQFLEGAPKFLEALKGSLEKNKNLSGSSDLTPEERASYVSDIRLAGFVLSEGPRPKRSFPRSPSKTA